MCKVCQATMAVLLFGSGLLAAEPGRTQQIEDFDAAWQEGRWQFDNGGEFPGAKGSFERSKDAAHVGEYGGKLNFDFTGGGNYVAAICKLSSAPDIKGVRVRVKNPSGTGVTFRYTDQSGQTLQKSVALAPSRDWEEIEIECWEWSGHWGGQNDGVVHGPPTMIAFLAENTGQKVGSLFLDDIRLVEGKPQPPVWNYVAARFEPSEGWHSSGDVQGAKGTLNGKTWKYDFTKGEAVHLTPRDNSLPGTPRQLRIRVKGDASGHTARLRMATHFMTFEKNIGGPEPVADEAGVHEFVTAAPPGEGWKWYGGENDGRLHGPLRITRLSLDCNGKRDSGELELLNIVLDAECSPRRLVTMAAEFREASEQSQFVARLRSLSDRPLEGELKWVTRNWAGATMEEGARTIVLPPRAEPFEAAVPVPAAREETGGAGHNFLETEFSLSIPNQEVPPAQAYQVARVPLPEGDVPRDPSSPFGMGLYLYRYGGDSQGLAEMDRAARMGAAAGVKWSREEMLWDRIEPRKGEFNWTYYDSLVATANRNGISIYALLHGWAGWTNPYTPEGIADYCRFAAAVVEHYKHDIKHWEVWNEPNIFFWQGPREMYAELLKQAYAAIKQVDPTAHVLGCSTAGIDQGFIQKTMELGAPFDILTIHPYRRQLDDNGFLADLQKAAELTKKPDGAFREVWITEMGWTTCVPHNSLRSDFLATTQRRQAELIARAYLDAIASGVAPNISWYDFRNDGTDPFNFEHNMGIVTCDFQPKPAYRAYAVMTQLLKGSRAGRVLEVQPGVIAYEFTPAGGSRVVALWSISGDRTVSLPADKPQTVTGLMGDSETLLPASGKVQIVLKNEVVVFVAAAAADSRR